jgi:hypothetical protein
MYRLNNKKRRIGGLLMEALVLIFVFSSAWSQTEFADQYERGQLIVKTSPVEQIAFRDSDSYIKSLLDFISKVQISEGNFTPFTVDLPSLEIANTSCLYISHSLYNSFYTHLTAKAP